MYGENGSVLILHEPNLEMQRYSQIADALKGQGVRVDLVGRVDDAVNHANRKKNRPDLAIVSLHYGLGRHSTLGINYAARVRESSDLPIYMDARLTVPHNSSAYQQLRRAKEKGTISGWFPTTSRPLDEQIRDILDEIRFRGDEDTSDIVAALGSKATQIP